jgi:hypothetical protein
MRVTLVALSAGLFLCPAPAPAEDRIPRAVVRAEAVTLGAGRNVTLIYDVEPPLKVNDKAPRRVTVGARKLRPEPGPSPYQFQVLPADVTGGRVEVETDFFVCEDRADAPCFRRVVKFEVPILAEGEAGAPLELQTPHFAPSPAGPLPDSIENN